MSGARQPMLWEDVNAPTVDIAEPARLGLLGVMKTSSPIHRDVAFVPRQPRRTLWSASARASHKGMSQREALPTHRPSRRDGTILEQPVEDRAIISHVICGHQHVAPSDPEADSKVRLSRTFHLLLGELVGVVGGDAVQEIDVFVRVELGHLAFRGWLGALQQISPEFGPSSVLARKYTAKTDGAALEPTKISIFL